MGAGDSRLCGEGFIAGCQRETANRSYDSPSMAKDPALSVIGDWIAAREMGDSVLAACFCHAKFRFSSSALTVRGRDAAREKLFTRPAPRPVAVLTPLQVQPGSGKDGRTHYFREVFFVVKEKGEKQKTITIRQEWTITVDSDHPHPLIESVYAYRIDVAARRGDAYPANSQPSMPEQQIAPMESESALFSPPMVAVQS